jgi:hypothetical protein
MISKKIALFKARELFGKNATVSKGRIMPGSEEIGFKVGVIVDVAGLMIVNEIKGTGRTWEEALQEAEKNK